MAVIANFYKSMALDSESDSENEESKDAEAAKKAVPAPAVIQWSDEKPAVKKEPPTPTKDISDFFSGLALMDDSDASDPESEEAKVEQIKEPTAVVA